MKVTYYSCLTSIMVTTILLSCLCFVRSKYHFTRTSEVRTFSFLYALSFVRLLFPLDFTITHGIPVKGLYSYVFSIFVYEKIKVLHWELSLSMMILFVVLSISFIKLCIYIKTYLKIAHEIRTFHLYRPQQVSLIENRIKNIYPRLPSCQVLESSSIHIPLAAGILKKTILLPAAEYSDSELYYILLHEYTHLIKNDLLKKYIVEIFCSLFWWIPFKKFIRNDLEQIIEINCDFSIINKIPAKEKTAYLDTLLTVVKRISKENNNQLPNALAFTAMKETSHAMVERFRLMAAKPAGRKSFKNRLLPVIAAALFGCSYFAVPMPSYEPNLQEIETSGYKYLSPDSQSYLYKEDNQYYLAIDGMDPIPVPAEHAKNMIHSGIKYKEVR